MFVLGPVAAAKPNLKVGGIAPFTNVKFRISISVSPASRKSPSLFKSKATVRRLGIDGLAGNNVIWTLLLASLRMVVFVSMFTLLLSIPPGTAALSK